jgi:hypothetical protein
MWVIGSFRENIMIILHFMTLITANVPSPTPFPHLHQYLHVTPGRIERLPTANPWSHYAPPLSCEHGTRPKGRVIHLHVDPWNRKWPFQ